tara:strand:+ start:759 stop:1049 length:291 start_codon:yes stop_codon:yes gene_type:complete
MPKALILNGEVVDISNNEFETHEDMTWVDCDSSVLVGFTYDGSTFTSNLPSQTDIDAANAARQAQRTAATSANQKLIDLGLTQEEVTSLIGYKPSE